MTDEDSNDEPISNSPFSKRISWRAFNEEIFPAHMASKSVFTGRAVSGPQEYRVQQNQFLSLSASINGRQRFETIPVTNAVLASLSATRTYVTRSWRFPLRLVLWTAPWTLAFAFSWIALSINVLLFIALFAVIAALPPFVASSIVDFSWWAGFGLKNESRARWILAIALWALDVGPLVLIQVRLV
jgi:hypothetical protein